jgi:hypothetical protein
VVALLQPVANQQRCNCELIVNRLRHLGFSPLLVLTERRGGSKLNLLLPLLSTRLQSEDILRAYTQINRLLPGRLDRALSPARDPSRLRPNSRNNRFLNIRQLICGHDCGRCRCFLSSKLNTYESAERHARPRGKATYCRVFQITPHQSAPVVVFNLELNTGLLDPSQSDCALTSE